VSREARRLNAGRDAGAIPLHGGRSRCGVIHGFRPATEPEVVLAFLRGEIDSERFGADVRRALGEVGGARLVRQPDLASPEENRARECALAAARGWRDTGLFEGFPERVDWCHGVLPPEILARVRYIDYSYWNELSGGSRRPADVQDMLRSGRLPDWVVELGTDWCFRLAARLAGAASLDDLIMVAAPDLSRIVVLEGHARLTGVFVGGLQERLTVRAYVGVSAAIDRWGCF
jgi:hypothetical protein